MTTKTIDANVLSNLSTKASKIRYVAEFGYDTKNIVRILNEHGTKISYQHVNNESIRLGLKTVTKRDDANLLKIRIALLEAELEASRRKEDEEIACEQ